MFWKVFFFFGDFLESHSFYSEKNGKAKLLKKRRRSLLSTLQHRFSSSSRVSIILAAAFTETLLNVHEKSPIAGVLVFHCLLPLKISKPS